MRLASPVLMPRPRRFLSVLWTAALSVAMWFGARALCELALPLLSSHAVPRRAGKPSLPEKHARAPRSDLRDAGPARPASRPGVRVSGVPPGSVLALLGIADGDVIESVNGLSLADPVQAMVLYARLPRERDLYVRVRRNGGPVTIVIHLV